MADPTIWTFTQLGGDKLVKQLGGWQAPFGRRRQSPLVNAGLKLRTQTTYYPGKGEPTVHVFGSAPKPWELKGRFMDAAIGQLGGALQYRRDWYDFVEAGQMVRATWGAFLSYRMVIDEIDLDIESSTDVAWRLRSIILADEASTNIALPVPTRTPIDIASAMAPEMAAIQPYSQTLSISQTIQSVLSLLPQISDTLDTVIDTINEPFAAITDICSTLSDFQTAQSSDLGKLNAGIQQMQNALLNMRDLTEQLSVTAATIDQPTADQPQGMFSGPDTIALTNQKIAADLATQNLLALIADMQNQIDLVQRGTVASAYQAQGNDTWDSIARRSMGSAASARAVRDLNGIRYGQRPRPGRTYSIPRTS